MANYATLKATIQQYIKQNGNNEITGNLLQQQLLAMITSLGAGYQYVGIATPATNPGTPDQNVFYLASTAGTYANFDGLVLADGEIAILKYNGAWSKDSTGAASLEKLNQLGQEVFGAEYELDIDDFGTDPSNPWYTSAGVAQTNANRLRTKKLAVDAGNVFEYGINNTSNVLMIAAFDANGDLVLDKSVVGAGGSSLSEGTYTVPSGVKFISFCSDDSHSSYQNTYVNGSVSGKAELLKNKVTLINSLSTDKQYPSAKSVYEHTKGMLPKSELELVVVSNNLADKSRIEDALINSQGEIVPSAGGVWQMIAIDVTPGKKYTFGGFYLGRSGYYAFYNNSIMVSSGAFNDPDGTDDPETVETPVGANILYIDIKSDDSPSNPYTYLQVNEGTSLAAYDEYKQEIQSISGYEILGTGIPQVTPLTIISDLPVSDGTDIEVGYAYIDSATGQVKVKLS